MAQWLQAKSGIKCVQISWTFSGGLPFCLMKMTTFRAEGDPVFDDDINLSDGLRDFHFYVGQVMGKMRCGE